MVRPILNKWHPSTKKVTYWFPTVFVLGIILSIILTSFNVMLPIYLILGYYMLAFSLALFQTKSIKVAFQSLIAITIQFFGYGIGFFKSHVLYWLFKPKPRKAISTSIF